VTTEPDRIKTVSAVASSVSNMPWKPKATSITQHQLERAAALWSTDDAACRVGYWECTVGEFTAVRSGEHEVCYIVSGRAVLESDDHVITHIGPGSMLVLPDGWSGTWKVHERLEKMFVIVAAG
jgi:uncharacterized protein